MEHIQSRCRRRFTAQYPILQQGRDSLIARDTIAVKNWREALMVGVIAGFKRKRFSDLVSFQSTRTKSTRSKFGVNDIVL